MSEQAINGVPADQYGMWCQHGKRIMVKDPADASDCPRLIFADPWPCLTPGCTRERVEAELEEEALEYEQERWQEYWDICADGLHDDPSIRWPS